MFDPDEYLGKLAAECKTAFGSRLMYLGLQGSYLRCEANENSDIDVMIVLDSLSADDMVQYRGILERIGNSEKACGFICGRDELAHWSPLEINALRRTTGDLVGSLSGLLPQATRQNEIDYVKLNLGNLYHELCHRYIHAEREVNTARFRSACKALFFLIRDLRYLETGEFILKKETLKKAVTEADRRMLLMAELPDGFDFDAAFRETFDWCRDAFRRIGSLQ